MRNSQMVSCHQSQIVHHLVEKVPKIPRLSHMQKGMHRGANTSRQSRLGQKKGIGSVEMKGNRSRMETSTCVDDYYIRRVRVCGEDSSGDELKLRLMFIRVDENEERLHFLVYNVRKSMDMRPRRISPKGSLPTYQHRNNLLPRHSCVKPCLLQTDSINARPTPRLGVISKTQIASLLNRTPSSPSQPHVCTSIIVER